MKGKKILEFLILKPAFTSRNVSSLGLVAIFFLIYWLAGGKVTIPDVKQGANFGTVINSRPSTHLGGTVAPTVPHRSPPTSASNSPSAEHSNATTDTTDRAKQLEEKLQKLNELEERLRNLNRAKSGGD